MQYRQALQMPPRRRSSVATHTQNMMASASPPMASQPRYAPPGGIGGSTPWNGQGGGYTKPGPRPGEGPSPAWQKYHESIRPRPPMGFGMPGDPGNQQAMWEYQKKLKEWMAMKEADWNGKTPGIIGPRPVGGGGAPAPGVGIKQQGLPGGMIPYRSPYAFG